MNDEKLVEILKLLKDLYPSTAPEITPRVILLYQKAFEGLKETIMDEAIVEAIKANKYANPPSIGSIMEQYYRIRDEHNDIARTLNAIYQSVIDLYPRGADTTETVIAYQQSIKMEKWENRIKKASYLKEQFMKMYYGRTENEPLPKFEEWIQQFDESLKEAKND